MPMAMQWELNVGDIKGLLLHINKNIIVLHTIVLFVLSCIIS